ncbi:MAG: histidine kinase [Flavobacteriales bacterium]
MRPYRPFGSSTFLLIVLFLAVACGQEQNEPVVPRPLTIHDALALRDTMRTAALYHNTRFCDSVLHRFDDSALVQQRPDVVAHAYISQVVAHDAVQPGSVEHLGLLATRTHSPYLRNWHTYLRGRMAMEREQLDSAIVLFTQVHTQFVAEADTVGLSLVGKRLGLIYLNGLREPERALPFLREFFATTNDPEERYFAAELLSSAYALTGQPDSVAHVQHYLDDHKKEWDANFGWPVPREWLPPLGTWRDTSATNGARVEAITQLHGLGDRSDLECLHLAFPALKDTTTPFAQKQLALVDMGRGNLLAWQDRCNDALVWFARAHGRVARLNDDGMMAQCDALCAFTLKNAGRLGEAISYSLRAVQGYTATKDSMGLVYAYHDLGYIFGAQGDISNGVLQYGKSLDLARTLYPDMRYSLCMRIAELELARSDRRSAMAWLDSATAEINAGRAYEYKSDIRLLKAEMALQDGKCDTALALLDEAREAQAGRIDRVSWESDAWSRIARAHLCASRDQDAINAANKGLAIARGSGLYKEELDNLLPLVRAQEAVHDIAGALSTRQRIAVVQDSMLDPGALSTLNSALVSAGYEQQALTDSLAAAQERSVAAAALARARTQRFILIGASVSILLLSILLVSRYRLKRRLQVEQLRTRLSRDLHDDIGSTLSSISILSNVLKKRAEVSGDADTAASIEKISERSQRLMRDMSDIVWSVDPGKDSMTDLVGRMREFGSAVLDPKGINFYFNAPEQVVARELSVDVKKNLYLIFKEAVNNAAKHAGAKSVFVDVAMNGRSLQVHVDDDGKGMRMDALNATGHGGNGLRNMKARAEEIGALFSTGASTRGGVRVAVELALG